jgi:predicted metalloprotease
MRRAGFPFARVLLSLIGFPLGLFFLFAVMNTLQGADRPAPPPVRPPALAQPSASVPAPPRPSQPTTSENVAPGDYVNDDYAVPAPDPTPPAMPEPQTWDDISGYLDNNPLYQIDAPAPVRCDITSIDLTTASKSALQTHFDDLTACLMRVWGPTLAQADFTAVRPTVTIYSGRVQTACGRMDDENAAYCGADQQIYYAADMPDVIPSDLRSSPFVVDSIVAHEFGHAVQARTGIFASEAIVEQTDQNQGDDEGATDASRRTEQQADCFAGEFLHAVAQSTGLTADDQATIETLFYSIGDDQLTGDPSVDGDHGLGADRRAWFTAGMSNQLLGTCNTFTASADSVR